MNAARSLIERDQRHVWHPYTQHGVAAAPLPVAAAEGSRLRLHDGREIVDAISSWWSCLHGHAHPDLVATMRTQVEQLDHVLFAGCTHEPAVRLAELLVQNTPDRLTRVFYSDNGSTAVEVALKMAYQCWVHRGEPDRRIFVTLEGSYHGDTFGAMSVGERDPFFTVFAPLLFRVRPAARNAAAVAAALDELGETAAGVIVEPRVQGAAGMVMHDDEFLRAVRRLCDAKGVPLIADEVMTGFGRTGSLFACQGAGISPDLLCLAKGLTGGMFPLAATLASEEIFAAFLSSDRIRTFFHGHTFTGHPVGCALACTSLELCLRDDVPSRLDAIGRRIEAGVAGLRESPFIRDVRRSGGIVAIEQETREGSYLTQAFPRAARTALEHGVLLRPLGPVLYAMPPACTSEAECDRIAETLREVCREQEAAR